MFYMFDVLIRPILTYGSDIWGLNKSVANTLDKVFLNYNRRTLHVKATTCNAIVHRECSKIPPSVYCHGNVLSYYHRLLTMPEGKVVKSVFDMLCNLNKQGFQTWTTRACELARLYNIDMNKTADLKSDQFKSMCSGIIKQICVYIFDLCYWLHGVNSMISTRCINPSFNGTNLQEHYILLSRVFT